MIKPLHFSDRIQVWHGPWQELIPMGVKVDVVLTDPPYTGHVHANIRSLKGGTHSGGGALRVKHYDVDFDPLTDYDHVPQLLSLARRWVLCFCALEQFGDYRAAAGGDRARGAETYTHPDTGKPAKRFTESKEDFDARLAGYVRSGIWRKKQAPPQLSGDRPANSCEGWALMHPRGGKLRWSGRGRHAYLDSQTRKLDAPYGVADQNGEDDPPSFVEEGRERAEKRHPTQKPLNLCRQLVQWFVTPGELVLDAYAGGGNLAWAAHEAGASVILCDTSEEWATFCARKADEIVKQEA